MPVVELPDGKSGRGGIHSDTLCSLRCDLIQKGQENRTGGFRDVFYDRRGSLRALVGKLEKHQSISFAFLASDGISFQPDNKRNILAFKRDHDGGSGVVLAGKHGQQVAVSNFGLENLEGFRTSVRHRRDGPGLSRGVVEYEGRGDMSRGENSAGTAAWLKGDALRAGMKNRNHRLNSFFPLVRTLEEFLYLDVIKGKNLVQRILKAVGRSGRSGRAIVILCGPCG